MLGAVAWKALLWICAPKPKRVLGIAVPFAWRSCKM